MALLLAEREEALMLLLGEGEERKMSCCLGDCVGRRQKLQKVGAVVFWFFFQGQVAGFDFLL